MMAGPMSVYRLQNIDIGLAPLVVSPVYTVKNGTETGVHMT